MSRGPFFRNGMVVWSARRTLSFRPTICRDPGAGAANPSAPRRRPSLQPAGRPQPHGLGLTSPPLLLDANIAGRLSGDARVWDRYSRDSAVSFRMLTAINGMPDEMRARSL